MRPITERDIRGSFVNCSKGEAKRLGVPHDLDQQPWDDLDFLGWRDPGAPDRGYLVAERDDGGLVGIALRAAPGAARGFTARSMCSLCLTTRTNGGVALMSARRTGEAGRLGNTVGQYVCADLACSLYVRGRKKSAAGDLDETLTLDERIARTRDHLRAFVGKVMA
ncbi:FBP domain-containing protein [Nonomuraea phyllanthi]|uniref:FBP domain-containing protein n=1 Tax=Nonomuraea phyllanthi TaxID=2219224 RepID=A0A5C4WT31_9ACTN|nr:FBP domain-containing protein [Nonomuraea phyllanthi]KAB8196797.1 FBP domain-containing protein [Nonomuraea phyllanthi]QFY13466.1 FBP domain-containing protein [Nonomuraea phyllanthi]